MKYLLLIAFVFFVFWLVKRNRTREADADKSSPPAVAPPDATMVRCAHCGVHLPRGEAVADGERLFCSEQHRRLAQPSD